ncbi:hypothetical protein [Synechocystis sp. PCC 7509]|uniref:hypothetical protein n=1 Tax=Synechocystis sp. PCC 7509 TaxID=927677 RepID=UPI0002AC3898|nr:hypothetical protein [Synechocystis sp. PCC 7509]
MAGKADSKQDTSKTKSQETTDTPNLDSLLELLQGDLSSIDATAGLEAVDEWYSLLHKSKDKDSKELADSLKELKQLLKGGKASGHEIGEALIHVGDRTMDIASDSDNEVKAILQKLGKHLTKVGNSLGKAEDQENIDSINTLTESLDELKSVEMDAATAAIDHWYGILHKSDDKHSQKIADNLKKLKQSLKPSKGKKTDLGEVLAELGEQTIEAAAEAPRGIKGAVQRLGKRLNKISKAIE